MGRPSLSTLTVFYSYRFRLTDSINVKISHYKQPSFMQLVSVYNPNTSQIAHNHEFANVCVRCACTKAASINRLLICIHQAYIEIDVSECTGLIKCQVKSMLKCARCLSGIE